MRFLTILAAVAVCAIATPTLANEARIEARGGIAWSSGTSTETIGITLGYDEDIAETIVVGVEAVADTDLNFRDPVLGLNGRIGAKLGSGKVFSTLGYAYDTWSEFDDVAVGAGYQHNIG